MRSVLRATGALRGRRGFTLTELMVALVLTALVIAATWRGVIINGQVTESVVGLSNVTERLALASDLISADAQQAGMYGSPNSTVDPSICPKPSGVEYRGLVIQDSPGSPAAPASAFFGATNPNVAPDAVIFQTVAETRQFHPTSMIGNVIDLSTDPIVTTELTTEEAFEAMFIPEGVGRLLRITSPTEYSQYVRVREVDFDDLTVTLVDAPTYAVAVSSACGVIDDGSDDHDIAVLTFTRYRVAEVDPANPRAGTMLIREEVSPADMTTPIARTRLVVAENVVDFQAWVDGVTPDPVTAQPVFRTNGFGGITTAGTAQAGPTAAVQRARIFHFQLAARTDREFSHVAHQPRANLSTGQLDLLRTFDADGNPATTSMVQTVTNQVELSNFVVRNLI